MSRISLRALAAAAITLLAGAGLVVTAVPASAATYCGYGQVGYVSTSSPTIQCFPEVTTSSPTITGTAMQGLTLKAVQGKTWISPGGKGLPAAGLPLDRYRWQRNGVDIPGATASSYTVRSADVGRRITVTMLTPVITGGQQWSWTSAATKLVIAPTLLNTVRPAISGTAQVGKTLSASTGTWHVLPTTYTYQWLRNGNVLPGKTGRTYVVTAADTGKAISVKVGAIRAGYLTGYGKSSQTALVR
jgi:hypothetical protein